MFSKSVGNSEGNLPLETYRRGWSDYTKWVLLKQGGRMSIAFMQIRKGFHSVFCELGNEPYNSMKSERFRDQLSVSLSRRTLLQRMVAEGEMSQCSMKYDSMMKYFNA